MEYEFVTDTREIQFPHFTIRIEEDNPEAFVDPPGLLDRRCFLIWKEELVRVTNVREIGVRVGVSLVSQDLQSDLETSAELLSALGGIDTRPLDESDRKSLQRDGFETSRLVTHNAGGVLTSYFIDWGNDQKSLFEIGVFLDCLTSETTLVANLYAASMLLLPNSSPLSWAQVAEAEYLELDRKRGYASDFYKGHIYTRLNTSNNHDQISLNLAEFIQGRMRSRQGQTYSGDMRVCIERTRYYTYPDLVVRLGEPEFLDQDSLLNPTMLVEIFSQDTEENDRGLRQFQYRQCPSLREYWAISEFEPFVEQFVRREDGNWDLFTTTGLDAKLGIHSINSEIPMSALYDDVALLQ